VKADEKVEQALSNLRESNTTYLVLVEFQESQDVYIDSRGDQTKGQRSKFMQALYHHWSGQPKTKEKDDE
jgi:hypothetical protein